MRAIALITIIIAAIPIIFLKPHVGVLVWSWLSYMNPHRLTWGATSQFGFAQIVGLVTIAAWLLSKEPKKIPWTPLTGLLLAFTLWMGWTTIFALAPDANAKWVLVMKIMLITFITLPLIQSRERIESLVWVIALSIGFFGIKGGVFVILTGGEYRVWGPEGSFIGANNALALALIMILPLLRYLQMRARSKWLHWALLAAMGLCGLSILSSYSRGALIAVLAMLGFMWLKSPRKLVLGVIGAVSLVAAIGFMPDKWTSRIETIQTYQQDSSAMSRLTMWKYGFNVATARPLFGGGFEIFPSPQFYPRFGLRLCKDYRHIEELSGDCVLKGRAAHSIYFEVLGEHGFVGLALFLLIGIVALRTGTRVIRQARGRPDLQWAVDLAAMLQVSMIGYAVGGTFLSKAYFDLYYALVAIMVLTGLVVERALRLGREGERAPIPVPAVGAAGQPAAAP